MFVIISAAMAKYFKRRKKTRNTFFFTRICLLLATEMSSAAKGFQFHAKMFGWNAIERIWLPGKRSSINFFIDGYTLLWMFWCLCPNGAGSQYHIGPVRTPDIWESASKTDETHQTSKMGLRFPSIHNWAGHTERVTLLH